ncbi:hypothetical protein vseg_011126 [Gypsophila vaccaria]
MDSNSIDPSKKRKLDENGSSDPTQTLTLTETDARQIIETLTTDNLRDILAAAVFRHPAVLSAVRAVADRDLTRRKLFIRGLGWDTTSESLRGVFAAYGELDEAVVILDKSTGKSKGYGFVTFRHIDGAITALKQPSKNIDGRIAVAALASAGPGGPAGGGGGGGGGGDTSTRKIYVGNVGEGVTGERLLSVFSGFGEIEEGPLGFDKATGKSKGFALFVYKTAEAAQAALAEPLKMVDGRQLVCKLASDGKKGKPVGPGPGLGGGGGGENVGMGPPPNGPYTGPGGGGGYSSYSGFSGAGQHPNNQMNPSYNTSVGGQGPGGYGGNAGYGSGGGYGGGSQYGSGPASGGYGGGYGGSGTGLGGAGGGGAGRGGYGMAPNSGGMPSGGGYPDGGHYGMSSGGYPSQQYQSTGASPAPRIPPAGAGGYPNPPPYY